MLSRRLLRIKVVKALYSHFKSESDSLTNSLRNLNAGINKTYELYHQMLWLVVDVADYAAQRIELAKNKKLPTQEDLNPNTRFVDNAIVAKIRESKRLGEYLKKYKLSWTEYPELIKNLYNNLIETDLYTAYMKQAEVGYKEDAKFIEDFYALVVAECPMLDDVVEEQSVLWADDADYAILMVIRSVTSTRATAGDVALLPQFKNDDDERFAGELFRAALVNYDKYIDYVERFTQNWDVERIAFLDSIIMVAAIAELVSFPTIPVKVTLDEFIEISKYYSTPSSSTFINGVLDKIVEALKEDKLINKEGRGLM